MKRILSFMTAALLGIVLTGCGPLEDDGVHLAYCLEAGAKKLAASPAKELTVQFEPLDGTNQIYQVQFCKDSLVVVWSTHGGSSTYHLNYVRVPEGFYFSKTNAAVAVTLRKANGGIEVADAR